MEMSKCIMVLGAPRVGTSCVAGVLHRLGVDMGQGHFQPKDRFNSRGYYEDLRWRYTNQRVTGKGYSTKGLDIKNIDKEQRRRYAILAQECQKQDLWGMKDPFLCFVGQFIWPLLDEPMIVAVNRNFDASVKSVAAHLGPYYRKKRGRPKHTARQIQKRWRQGFLLRLEEFEGPVHHINYEELVEFPGAEAVKLARLCFDKEKMPSGGVIKKAAQWVTPKLKHF